MTPVNPRHARPLNSRDPGPGPVIYWMHRNHRWRDNWALLFARQLAAERKAPLAVVYGLAPRFLEATLRQYGFLLRGLEATAAELQGLGVPFFLLPGDPPAVVLEFCRKHRAGALVADFDPLRVKRGWLERVAADLPVAAWEVDARNVVPCWVASDKQEYAARTIRPKIHRLLPEFLEDFPEFGPWPHPWPGKVPANDFGAALAGLHIDRTVTEVDWLHPGEAAAAAMLRTFIDRKLAGYAAERNDPTLDGLSNLSPYLHFGMLAGQRAALDVAAANDAATVDGREAFLEELVVRRELADNFCLYNPDYDRVEGFPQWARKTLQDHAADRRDYLYDQEELEHGRTHDPLWNAAQLQMVRTGKMHGYMRMYWAKKILEWTPGVAEAMRLAILLNDRYELDGRDTNGYVGIAWSLGGVHDRAWFERPVFGKIRYMSARGAAGKFDVAAYVAAQEAAGR